MITGLTPTSAPSASPGRVLRVVPTPCDADISVPETPQPQHDDAKSITASFFAAMPVSPDHHQMALHQGMGPKAIYTIVRHGPFRNIDTFSARAIAEIANSGVSSALSLAESTDPSGFLRLYKKEGLPRSKALDTFMLLSQAGNLAALDLLFTLARYDDPKVLKSILDVLGSPKESVVKIVLTGIREVIGGNLMLASELAELASIDYPNARSVASSINIDPIIESYLHAPPNGSRGRLGKLVTKYAYLENEGAALALFKDSSLTNLRTLLDIYEGAGESFKLILSERLESFDIKPVVRDAKLGGSESVRALNKLAGIIGGGAKAELERMSIDRFVPAVLVSNIDACISIGMLAVNGNREARDFVFQNVSMGTAKELARAKSSRSLKALVWLALAGSGSAQVMLRRYDLDLLINWIKHDQRLLKHFLSLHMFGHPNALEQANVLVRVPILRRFFTHVDPRIFFLEIDRNNGRAIDVVSFLKAQGNPVALEWFYRNAS